MKILLAEDEKKVQVFITKGLENAEFSVDAVSTLDELFANLLTISYDIIILDRLLKGRDALKYIPHIKEKNPNCKILILSAMSEVDEKVAGLEGGADDYMAKPFHLNELLARIRVMSRKNTAVPTRDNILLYEDLKIKLDSQKVERAGKHIELTPKEYKLLVTLLKKPNRIFSKMEIINEVWEIQYFPESNVVEVFMNHLRSKINKGFASALIHSKRGAGYWLGDKNQ